MEKSSLILVLVLLSGLLALSGCGLDGAPIPPDPSRMPAERSFDRSPDDGMGVRLGDVEGDEI